MVWAIAPAVSGADRRRVVTFHVTGLLAGALTTCLMLTLAGAAIEAAAVRIPSWHHVVVAGVLLGWLAHSGTRLGLPYPRSRWQVPESWRGRLPLKATVLSYGYLLGLGPLTDVIAPTFWLLVGISITALDAFSWVLLAWLTYGATRAVVTIAGIHHYDVTCAIDGAPRSSSVRPSRERVLVSTFTVLLFLFVASAQLVAFGSR